MNKNLKKFLELRGLTIEDLGLDPNKDEFTFEEIFNLSIELQLPFKSLFSTVVRNKTYYSVKSFERGVLNGEIDKVVNTIVAGYVLNINDKLYYTNTNYRISDKNLVNKEVSDKLLELLLMNNYWLIARMISSKNYYYKFNNIFDERFPENSLINYLLGKYDFDSLSTINLDYYSELIFNGLDFDSQEYVKNILMENYRCLFSAYSYGKSEGENFEIGKNYFAYFIEKTEDEQTYHMHFITDIYKNFSAEEQKEVTEILELIK